MIFDDSINKWKFKVFIQALRESFMNEKICIYFDNLSVHRSKDVRDELDHLVEPAEHEAQPPRVRGEEAGQQTRREEGEREHLDYVSRNEHEEK